MPYTPSMAHGKTRKANTAKRSRQWVHVYDSAIQSGDDEGTAITKANGVVKKQWKKTNPARRKPVDHRPAHMKTAGATSPQFAVGFAKEAGVLRGAGKLMHRAGDALMKGDRKVRMLRHTKVKPAMSAVRSAMNKDKGVVAKGVKRVGKAMKGAKKSIGAVAQSKRRRIVHSFTAGARKASRGSK